jgi:tetratricopeptide (TPR) repeat protein
MSKGISSGPAASAGKKPAPVPPPVRVAPLFRRIDWIAMLLTALVVWTVYFLTLAPELTLEDSGELVTGSFYAGIPHPPGYPVWTMYSWLWTQFVPWGNMAWRVALAEAFLGGLACGLLSLMVSRGSSLFMESIEEIKSLTGKWESAICMVAGCVAGLLMGLDGFMWKESVAVNRIAVSSVPYFLVVLLCIMRWLYAPHQYKFLYWGMFIYGICITTHQSLIVAAIGIEVAIAAGNPRLGRDAFLGNSVFYIIYNIILLSTGHHLFANLARPGMLLIFNVIGIGSIVTCIALAIKTKAILTEWKPVLLMAVLWIVGVSFYFYMPISGMTNPPMQWGYPRTVEGFFHALSRGQYEQPNPTNILAEPGRFASQLWMLVTGAAEEFTWVYMLFALVPFVFFFKVHKRERAWLIGLSAIYLFLGVVLMVLFNPSTDKASADIVKVFFNNSHTIVAALIGYGMALTAAFMATNYKRFRVWGLAGGVVAAAVALYVLIDTVGKHYFGPAGTIRLSELAHWIGQAFGKNQYGLPIYASLLLVLIPIAFIGALLLYRNRAPLLITLGLFISMPLYSGMSHWFDSSQHNHWFGYWFGHDMFTPPFTDADGKPIYPEMTKDAILYGGTDPGRFCPTYMIFCESFTPHNCQPLQDQKFDRRDVYIITQNALADGTYLDYIRAHYNRSTQIDPPFFQELVRSDKEKEFNYETNLFARLVSPLDTVFENHGARVEKRRRTFTSWFTDKDFLNLPAFAARLRTSPDRDPVSTFIYENLSPETRQLLSAKPDESLLRRALIKDLNLLLDRELQVKRRLAKAKGEKAAIDEDLLAGSTSQSKRGRQQELEKTIAELSKISPLYTPDRFKQVEISPYLQDFIKENPQSDTRVRLNRLLLEAAYPDLIARSLGGVYPDREMYIATPDDSSKCFQEYLADAQKRLQHDMQFPNELKQIKPGEDVHFDQNTGKVTVAGTVAVMAINGLLTKVMFDHNPKNEFFVEESFPLDWMYPYLTPYGVIMKVNRKPLPSLTEDIFKRDHDFWKQYSKRFTGDFIDYDTPLKDICQWIEKVYVRHDYNGFTGDVKFLHDDDAQKAFSKLRSSIGGVYAWRLNPQQCPPEYRPKSDAEAQRLLKEAEFTFRQAFAVCPYSPEAVFRYVNLLLQFERIDDALIIAQTCLKLDPFNDQVRDLVNHLQGYSTQRAGVSQVRADFQRLENEVRNNPTNFAAGVELARACYQLNQAPRAAQILDGILADPRANLQAVLGVAQTYMQVSDWPKLELALEKLTKLSPDSPEAWYDLAGLKANLRKNQDALPALAKAIQLSTRRLQRDPKAKDLVVEARKDERFTSLHSLPEYQKLVPP